MNWKELAPYAVPVLVMALLARRVMKAQQPSVVRLERLWIFPAILLVLTGVTLAHEPIPTIFWMAAFVFVAAAGGAFGWFRVHTLEFIKDPDTGAVTSKSSPFGAIVLVALLLLRYAIKYFLSDEGIRGVELVRWTDGGLIFSAAMLAAQSAHTWVRARRLPPAVASRPESGGASESSG
jgi:membrane protein CcdC involved in cytochrome C biogenesis